MVTTEGLMFERQVEVEVLRTCLDAARVGSGEMVMIVGPAGVGKSRLLDRARHLADRTATSILQGRGASLEQEDPFGLVRQLFEPMLIHAPPAQRGEWLAGAAADAMRALETAAGCAARGDFAILHGLYWLTVNLTRTGPLVLVIDDLHWSDEPSLRFLAYLLPRLKDLPIAVIAAARPRQPGGSALLDIFARDTTCRRLEPGALSLSASTALLTELFGRLPQPRFSEACYRATGGNPLLLRQLVRALSVEGLEPVEAHISRVNAIGSRALSRRVSMELARLPDDHRRIIEAMAVLGPQESCDLAARLADIDKQQASAVISALVATELLRVGNQGKHKTYEFIHPLVQQAAYDQLPVERRHDYHAKVARVLAEMGAVPDRIAAHLIHTMPGTAPDAVAILRRAAGRALAGGSHDGALTYLRRALMEPLTRRDRLDILTEAASAAARSNLGAVIAYLQEALNLLDDRRARAELAEILGLALLYTEQDKAAVNVLTEAIDGLPEEDDDLRRALQSILLDVPTIAVGWDHIATQVPTLRQLPSAHTRGALMLDCMIAAHDTYAAEPSGLERARRAVHDPRLVVTAREGATMAIGAYFSVVVGDLEEGIAAQSDLIAQARQHGSLTALCQGLNFRALCWLRRGELTEAQTDLDEASQTARLAGISVGDAMLGALQAECFVDQGRLDRAEAALCSVSIPDPPPPSGLLYWYLQARARLRQAEGRHQEALEAAMQAGERFAANGGCNPAILAWRSTASLTLQALSRPEEALALAHEEVDLARRWRADFALGRALRVQGLIMGGETGLEVLNEAVSVLEGGPARLEYAAARVSLGAALRRANERAEARVHLAEGSYLASHLGAASLADLAETELQAAGGRSPRRMLYGPQSLTPSEQRVAEMASRGMTNREIAQQLYITIKTVEAHLGSSYQKLGITRRTQLQ